MICLINSRLLSHTKIILLIESLQGHTRKVSRRASRATQSDAGLRRLRVGHQAHGRPTLRQAIFFSLRFCT